MKLKLKGLGRVVNHGGEIKQPVSTKEKRIVEHPELTMYSGRMPGVAGLRHGQHVDLHFHAKVASVGDTDRWEKDRGDSMARFKLLHGGLQEHQGHADFDDAVKASAAEMEG
jgi:hypothetical protein